MPTGISNGNHNVNRSHRDFVAYWEEEGWKQKRETQRAELEEEAKKAYQELIAIDPEGGEAWYDNDENVPAVARTLGGIRERVGKVRARIEYLKAQKGGGSDG